MSVRTDKVNLIISINGDKARDQLNELRKKSADLSTELKGMTANTQEYVTKSAELKKVEAEMAELKEKIGITSFSLKELGQERRKLTAILNSKQPGDSQIASLRTQLQAVIERQKEVKNGMLGLQKVTGDLGYSFKSLGTIAASYIGFQAMITGIKNVIASSAKFTDQLADIQRVAGLTADEAVNLANQLKTIDTRSSVDSLLDIAIVAGKLGVAKDDIYSFTKAVDQLVVALGDELGNADQITTQLGKILNVFDGKITGDNISKLGNAIVDLANKGVATGGFVVDFTQRLSGLAKTAGLSLASVLGFGAGLEENGAKVESAATALQKLITTIGTDVPKAAQIAGMNVKEFTDLFAKEPQEALLAYAAGLQKNKASFAEIASSFKDAGEEGARVVSTLSIIGQKTDFFRQKIKDTGVALQQTSSITNAFALKNETLGGEIEKIGKILSNIITSKVVTFFTVTLASGFTKLLSIFKQTSSALDQFKEQSKTFDELQNSIGPLIDRVEKLSTTSNLSKEGQIELASAIQAIGQTIPIAVTEFDKYGKAIGISTDKAREFIELQRAILKEKNRSAISEQADKLTDLQKELDMQKGLLRTYQKQGAQQLQNIEDLKKIGHEPSKNALEILEIYNKGIANITDKINQLQSRIIGTKGIIDELNGNALAKSINGIKPTETTDKEDPNSVAARRAKLQTLIDDSKVAYEKLNATDKAGQKANLAQRQKYQDELDALDNKEKKKNAEKYNSLKKDYESFLKELNKLKRENENSKLSDSDREVQEVQQKYADLLQRAADFHKKLHTLDSTYDAQTKQLVKEKLDEIEAIRKKYFEKSSEEEYQQSIKTSDEYFAAQKRNIERQYAEGKINKNDHEAALTGIESREINNRIGIAEDYLKNAEKGSDFEKKLAQDVAKFRIDQQENTTNDLKKQTDRRIELLQQEADAARDIRNRQINDPRTSPAKRNELIKKNAGDDKDAALIKLKEQLQAAGLAYDEASVNATKKGKAIWAQYYETLKNADDELLKTRIENIANYAALLANGLDSINQIINNSENRQFAKEQALNAKKTQALKKQLNSKLISQKQYDLASQKLADDADKKDRKLKHDQAVRQKVLDLFSATINTARAVVEALPNVFLATAIGIMGGLQIAAIATEPVPELGDGGLIKNGPYHKDKEKGLPVIDPRTGKTEMLLEKDEGVVKGDAMRDKNKYTVTGTPSQIASKLNSMHGGVNWAGGATLQPAFRKPPLQLNPGLPRIMEQGGIVRPMYSSPQVQNNNDELFRQMIAKQDELIEEVKNQKERLHAVVSIKEYREKEKVYDNARRAGGMSQ